MTMTMNPQLIANLSALDGTASPVVANPAATSGLVTLTATDNYYFIVPRAAEFRTWSIHILTGAAIAGTFTVEACNFPKETDGKNIATVADNDETSGNWVQLNTAAAGYAQGVGTGWTITVLSLAKTAGAGGAIINLVDFGSRRLRLNLNCTTGGTVRVVAIGKN